MQDIFRWQTGRLTPPKKQQKCAKCCAVNEGRRVFDMAEFLAKPLPFDPKLRVQAEAAQARPFSYCCHKARRTGNEAICTR